MVIPESNKTSFGFIDLQDANGVASSEAKLIANNTSFEGSTDGGSFFRTRTEGQSIELNNTTANVTMGNDFGILNADKPCSLTINGGNFNYLSPQGNNPVFSTLSSESTVTIKDATVTSNVGPVVEVYKSTGTVTNCDFTVTGAPANHHGSCLAVSGGGELTVDGGTYKGEVAAIHVYNSGGTITVDGGTFIAPNAIQADNSTTSDKSVVMVKNGTFDGDLKIGSESELSLSGGNYTDSNADMYCADGFILESNGDGTYGVVEDSGSTTGIENVVVSTDKVNKVYNLHGKYMGDSLVGLTPGIYITNGKKVVVK